MASAVVHPPRTLVQRIPWLWYDYVVTRSRVPLWLLALIPFAINHSMGIVLAAYAGELPKFLRDWRWLLTTFAMPVVSAFILGYAPRALDRLWVSMLPWLANSEEELAAFQAAIPQLLMRFFWVGALLFTPLLAMWAFLGPIPGNWQYDYTRPEVFNLLILLIAPIDGYFLGAAFSVVGIGIGLLAQRMDRTLDLKREFVLQGGKAALQPFNQLLWAVWGTFVLPAIVVGGLAVSTTALPAGSLQEYNIVSLLLLGLVVVPAIVIPQLVMNRWLDREKREALRALQRELAEVADCPPLQDPSIALPRLIRHQHLIYQIQQVQSFTPTLVDARFVGQIVTSVVVIVLANIVIRTVFAGLLS